MRKKPDLLLSAVVLLLTVLPVSVAAQKAAAPAPRPKRLVRVDLLTARPVERRPVKRDVFSPDSGSAALSPAVSPDSTGGPASVQQGAPGAPAGAEGGVTSPGTPALGGEPPVYIPSVRYIGYVDFGRKLTALVIADGQPLAVEEKDEVLPGFRVVTITTERIELVDPSGTKRSYLREGEQP